MGVDTDEVADINRVRRQTVSRIVDRPPSFSFLPPAPPAEPGSGKSWETGKEEDQGKSLEHRKRCGIGRKPAQVSGLVMVTGRMHTGY
jgi:hypothetical protein